MKKLVISLLSTGLLLSVAGLSSCMGNDLDQQKIHPASIDQQLLYDKKYKQGIQDLMSAEIHYHLKHYGRADYFYSHISGLYENTSVLHHAIDVALKRHDFDKALELSLLWYEETPSSMSAVSTLVGLYEYFGRYEDALELLKIHSISKDGNINIDTVVSLLEQHPAEESYRLLTLYAAKFAPQDSQVFLHRVIFALNANLYQEAIDITDNLPEKITKELSYKVAILRVQAYTSLGEPELAMDELQTLIRDAIDIDTKQKYARIMAFLGKTDTAISLLKQEFKKHPKHSSYLHDIISIYLNNNQLSEALPVVEQLAMFAAEKDNANFYKGLIYLKKEDKKQSLQAYLKISEQGLSNAIRSTIVTLLYETQGLDVALNYLHQQQKLLSSPDKIAELYVLEADLLREVREFDLALEVIESADKLFPNNINVYYSRALLFENVGDFDKSEQSLHEILAVDASDYSALNALGYLLSVHTSRFDEAYGYIKRAYDLQPHNAAIMDSLGWISYQKGDLYNAEKYLRLAYIKMPDPEVATHLARVLDKRGNKKEAYLVLKEMIKKHPNNKQLIKLSTTLGVS